MSYLHRYTVEETLQLIQELDSDKSESDGDELVSDGNEVDDSVKGASASSLSSDESDVKPLRKRIKVPLSHPISAHVGRNGGTSIRRGRGRRERGSKTDSIRSVPVGGDVSDSDPGAAGKLNELRVVS